MLLTPDLNLYIKRRPPMLCNIHIYRINLILGIFLEIKTTQQPCYRNPDIRVADMVAGAYASPCYNGEHKDRLL